MAVVVALILIVVETFFVMGIVRPVVIEGSSMAPTLLGPHVQVNCSHCAWDFAVGADQLPGPWPLLCPDCRKSFHQPDEVPLTPGRRLWVDRTRYARRSPDRFDLVVFRSPDQASEYCVKRIVGLPGEVIAFDAGDLIIDGEVVCKSIDEQIEFRQLVHRERDGLRLWQTESPAWKWRDGAWHHTGDASGVLTFQPAGGKVTDDLGVNQRASRLLNEVADLMVTCDMTLSHDARLEFRADFGDEDSVSGEVTSGTGRVQVVWSLFDRKMLLLEDGSIVARRQYDEPWAGTPRLTVIASGPAKVENLAVWRDAYYHTRPRDLWPRKAVKLASGEYFVVGDNVAISADSRSWRGAGLPERLILGAPMLVD